MHFVGSLALQRHLHVYIKRRIIQYPVTKQLSCECTAPFYSIHAFPMSLVHYCIWGLCESWEYCCGDNECCREADFNFLLLTAFILGALLFVALFCICIYCGSRRSYYAPFLKKNLKISYMLMSSQVKNKVADQNAATKDSVIQIQTTKVSL